MDTKQVTLPDDEAVVLRVALGFWDGYLAGVRHAVEEAKGKLLKEAVERTLALPKQE